MLALVFEEHLSAAQTAAEERYEKQNSDVSWKRPRKQFVRAKSMLPKHRPHLGKEPRQTTHPVRVFWIQTQIFNITPTERIFLSINVLELSLQLHDVGLK